ncbi:FtsX-like permease family protein [bacterium]|nr:FtsX-like permease family protein [bacterium]
MLLNYLRIALRQLWKNKIYSFINLIGFAIGLMVCLAMGLYVLDELSFDRQWDHAQDIYRVWTYESTGSGAVTSYAVTSGALMDALDDHIPEVERSTFVQQRGQAPVYNPENESEGDASGGVQAVMTAVDSNFTKVFQMPLLRGNPDRMLRTPNSVVITRSLAQQVYGGLDAIGKPLRFRDPNNAPQNSERPDFIIDGIIEDLPRQTHLHFDILLPLIPNEQNRNWVYHWENVAVFGYLRATPGTDRELLEQKVNRVARDNNFNYSYHPRLMPVTDIHLKSNFLEYNWINWNAGDMAQVTVFGLVAGLVLVIASINFINLSSARAVIRAREVGLRKTVGASRSMLMRQFLGESVIMTFFSTILAVIGAVALHPIIREQLLRRDLGVVLMDNLWVLPVMAVTILAVGLLAGFYPALVLSGFTPVQVLKGRFKSTRHAVALRQGLVVVQFAVSIALMIGVLVVRDQVKHISGLSVGYNRELVVWMPTWQGEIRENIGAFREKLDALTFVEDFGSSSLFPLGGRGRLEVLADDANSREESKNVVQAFVGERFFRAMQIDVVDGRTYSRDYASDTSNVIVINEALAKSLAYEGQVSGRSIGIIDLEAQFTDFEIIGVVSDFHFHSARNPIEPTIYHYVPNGAGVTYIRLKEGDIGQAVEKLKEVWTEVAPHQPPHVGFMDESIEQLYQGEQEFMRNLGLFFALALIIACLGLFGLTAYATEQRRREIAVRKVLGSSEPSIVSLLLRDFLKWVAAANLVAWPLAFFATQQWVEQFIFKAGFSPAPYLISTGAALLIAMMTIGYLTIRASRTSPAIVLRSE